MRNYVMLLVGVLVALLTGCASVPMASLDKDAKAKDYSTDPSKASLFIYRNETFGAAIPVTVSVNGKTLGQTAAMTYFRLNLSPGKYTINSHAENVSMLDLILEAGKNYFVWQEIKMGMWSAGSKLQQVGESIGRAGVSESKLIASSFSDSDIDASPTLANSASTPAKTNDLSASKKLRELQSLKKDGVISEDEFEKKKQQLLEKL